MQILNVGIAEIIIVLILMFLLLGPKEMVRTAYRLGVWIRKTVRSPIWHEIMNYSQEIRELPHKMMEESGLQESLDEVRQTTKQTADELNTQLKEAADAARVPEMENLRIDPKIKPAEKAVPAGQEVAQQEVAAAAQEVPEEAGLVDAPVGSADAIDDAGVPAVLDVAETAGVVAAPQEAAAEVEPKPKRGRKPKAAVPQEEVAEEPKPKRGRKPKAAEVPQDEVAEEPKPKRGRKPKVAAQQEVAGQEVAGAQQEVAAEVEPKPKRGRKPKVAAQQEVAPQEVAGQEVAEGARVYVAAESPQPAAETQPAKARTRKPRVRKNAAAGSGNGLHPDGDQTETDLSAQQAAEPVSDADRETENPHNEEPTNPDAA